MYLVLEVLFIVSVKSRCLVYFAVHWYSRIKTLLDQFMLKFLSATLTLFVLGISVTSTYFHSQETKCN